MDYLDEGVRIDDDGMTIFDSEIIAGLLELAGSWSCSVDEALLRLLLEERERLGWSTHRGQ